MSRSLGLLPESVNLIKNPFTEREEQGWLLAHVLVHELLRNPVLNMRCHEIARAMGRVLMMDVQDGFIASPITNRLECIQHSWLWTRPGFPGLTDPHALVAWDGNILDPWVMGGLPRVQLLQARTIFGHLPGRYWPTDLPEEIKIDEQLVNELEAFFVNAMERRAGRT